MDYPYQKQADANTQGWPAWSFQQVPWGTEDESFPEYGDKLVPSHISHDDFKKPHVIDIAV